MTKDEAGSTPGSTREVHPARARLLKLALTMVVVAGLGAYTAYRTEQAEQEASELERRFAQGHVFELAERQLLLEQIAANARFDEHDTNLRLRAEDFAKDAERLTQQDPIAAADFSLRSQEERAADSSLRPFLALEWDPLYDHLSIEESLKRRVARTLAYEGFEAAWIRPPAKQGQALSSSLSIWHRLDAKVTLARARTRGLAFGVVLFVVSLTFFTLSDLLRRPAWGRRSFWAGVVLASGAVVRVVIVEPSKWWQLLLVLASLLALCGLVWRRSRAETEAATEHLEPAEVEGRSFLTRAYLHVRLASADSGRLAISMIALTVLCSAVAACWFSAADAESSVAANEAMHWEVEMSTRASRLATEVGVAMQDYAGILEHRVRAAAARQRAEHLKRMGALSAAAVAEADAAEDSMLATVHDQEAAYVDGPDFGADADPLFPQRLIKQVPLWNMSNNRWEAVALWDTCSGQGLAWHHKAGVFLGTLTLFAITLYLFGQAHTMGHGPASRTLMGFGIGLLIPAMVFAVVERLAPIQLVQPIAAKDQSKCKLDTGSFPRPSTLEEQAARHYATANVYMEDARSETDYQNAVRELECTVAMRPDFALAKAQLSAAILLAGSSQRNEGYQSLGSIGQLPTVISVRSSALKTLVEHGYVEPIWTVNGVGFDTLLLALANKDPKGIATSIKIFQHALDSSNDAGDARESLTAMVHLNLALALRAAGREGEAEAELTSALAEGAAKDEELIASALTDLEILVRYCDGIRSKEECASMARAIGTTKERLVKETWAADPSSKIVEPPREMRQIEAARIRVTPDSVQWQGRVPDFNPSGDSLAIIWYALDGDQQVWHVLPDVSGSVKASEVSEAMSGWSRRSYLAETGRCLGSPEPTQYRAEFYLNGRLSAPPVFATLLGGAFDGVRFPDLNVTLCKPSVWQAGKKPSWKTVSGGNLPEAARTGLLVRSFNAGDKTALAMFTFFSPTRGAKGFDPLRVAQRVMKEIDFTPRESLKDCNQGAPAAALVKHWITAEGIEHIGVGLTGNASAGDVCVALDSMEELYRPRPPVDRNSLH